MRGCRFIRGLKRAVSRISPKLAGSDGRVRNQIRGEMALECRERCRVSGREPEADMAIGADQDDAACSEDGANQATSVGRYRPPSRTSVRARTSSTDTVSTASSTSWKLSHRPPGSGASSSKPSGPKMKLVSSSGERCPHRDVSNEEVALVGRSVERLIHRVAGDAVGPACTNDDTGVDRPRCRTLRARVRLGRRRLHRNSQRQSMPSKVALRSSDRSALYKRVHRTCSAVSRNGESRPTESRISRVPGWIARGTRLSVPSDLPLDQPHPYPVAGELAGGEQPGRSGAYN